MSNIFSRLKSHQDPLEVQETFFSLHRETQRSQLAILLHTPLLAPVTRGRAEVGRSGAPECHRGNTGNLGHYKVKHSASQVKWFVLRRPQPAGNTSFRVTFLSYCFVSLSSVFQEAHPFLLVTHSHPYRRDLRMLSCHCALHSSKLSGWVSQDREQLCHLVVLSVTATIQALKLSRGLLGAQRLPEPHYHSRPSGGKR